MGTFMSKHCSPMSYGTPLEKKSCANYGSPAKHVSQKYGKDNEGHYHYKDKEGKPLAKFSTTPLNQEKKEHVPAEFKDPNFMKRLESLNPQTKKNIMDRIKRRDSMAIAKHGSIEAMKKAQMEAEALMTKEEKSRDDY